MRGNCGHNARLRARVGASLLNSTDPSPLPDLSFALPAWSKERECGRAAAGARGIRVNFVARVARSSSGLKQLRRRAILMSILDFTIRVGYRLRFVTLHFESSANAGFTPSRNDLAGLSRISLSTCFTKLERSSCRTPMPPKRTSR